MKSFCRKLVISHTRTPIKHAYEVMVRAVPKMVLLLRCGARLLVDEMETCASGADASIL